jgi:hypothetical protein
MFAVPQAKKDKNFNLEVNEPHLVKFNQDETLSSLKQGKVENVRASSTCPVDQIVLYSMKQGLLQNSLRSFPDPRKKSEVPIEVLLLPQILQRLNDEHSLLLAPYMLNNAELIESLGYNAIVLEEGFNKRNVHPRKTAFHGETLKHVLLGLKADSIMKWFNESFQKLLKTEAPGRTKQYILDGTKIEIPSHLGHSYQQSGLVSDVNDKHSFGYKAVWLQEIIDKKGVIVALKIVPIQRHDIDVGRELVADFVFEPGSCLIMDRGFIDAEWITHLKKTRGVDVVIPLKKNMEVTKSCVELANERGLWKPHPTRKKQQIAELGDKPGDLLWIDCPVITHGVLARWTKKNGEITEVLFVTTQEKSTGKKILATYDQRTEIEESHRQIKCFQGLEKLPSKKFVQVVFRIVMGAVGFNLLNLFLNSESCEDLDEFSLKTLRQKRPEEKNPKVIIYAKTTFGILRLYQLLPTLMRLKGRVKEELIAIFESLDPNPAPI